MKTSDNSELGSNSHAQLQVHMCTHCGIEKTDAEFYSKGDRRDSRCKECIKQGKNRRRKMHVLSELAKRKRVKNLIEVETKNIHETTWQGESSEHLDHLIQDLVTEVILKI